MIVKKIFLIITFLITQVSFGQSNTVCSGGSGSGQEGSIEFSIGQIDYLNVVSDSFSFGQGTQQPYEIYTLSIVALNSLKLDCQLYPNPAIDKINLDISSTDLVNMELKIFDIQGKEILCDKIVRNNTIIDINNLKKGSYTLVVLCQGLSGKVYKIIKND